MSSNSSIYINGVLQDPKQPKYTGQGIMTTYTLNQHAIQPLSSITLSNINGNVNSWLNDLSSTPSTHPSIKQYEMYESPVDVLALSCTLQRMRKDKQYGYKILDATVMSKLSDEDKEKATAIRDFYSKKIMMGKLKENLHMSPFRKDLSSFVLKDGLVFKKTDIGMVCYLPDFYDYDVALDAVKSQVNTSQDFKTLTAKNTPSNLVIGEVNLTPLSKILRKTKHSKQMEYWFKDDKLNAGVLVTLDPKNPLLSVWNNIFDKGTTLVMDGNFHRKQTDDFEYFSVTNWELQKG